MKLILDEVLLIYFGLVFLQIYIVCFIFHELKWLFLAPDTFFVSVI